MRYLLDTHTLLWSLGKSDRLSPRVRSILDDLSNHVMVSAISLWEISLKYGLGKLVLGSVAPEDIPPYCARLGYEMVPLESDIASTYHQLTRLAAHKDPFDRMLVHQCIRLRATLLSRDTRMAAYKDQGLICIW